MSDNTNKTDFSVVLLQHGKGLEHDRASQMLSDAVAAAKNLGKPATVTVQLRVEPMKNNPRVVQISAKAAAKIPQATTPPALFFTDDDNNLHRNDPLQRELWDTAAEPVDGKSAAAGRD